MAFFKKFSIDFNRAALWGIHCIPKQTRVSEIKENSCDKLIEYSSLCSKGIPARGVLAVLLCARWSPSALEPDDVDGRGLLSMATSDTENLQYWQINNSQMNHYTMAMQTDYNLKILTSPDIFQALHSEKPHKYLGMMPFIHNTASIFVVVVWIL